MNIIIPMMGQGQRFKDAGYLSSKPMTRAYGKEILFWLIDCLNHNENNILLVCRKDAEAERLSERIKSNYHDSISLLMLDGNTEGAAHTVQLALQSGLLDLSKSVAVCDSDTFYSSSHIEKLQTAKNAVFYFVDSGVTPIFSYLGIEGNRITEIAEKTRISNYASVGTYCFETGYAALRYCEKIISSNVRVRGEYYMSSVIQAMVDDGAFVEAIQVDEFHCLGTPPQLQGFNPNKKLRVCFDIDDTLVSKPKIPDDYSSVEPIEKNIEFLRFLKNDGHIIILQTARKMKNNSGNVGKSTADVGKITFETLEKFEIPFDEIYFGKPHADLYVDSKAIDSYSNIEKSTGLYQNNLISRAHNTVTDKEDVVIKSSSRDSIKGELFWYLNAPTEIKHLLPKLLNHNEKDGTLTIELEKINGPTLSKMLVIDSLNEHHIKELCGCLESIHLTKVENLDVDIKQNYSKKLDKRYFAFDVKDKQTKILYEEIKEFLVFYESSMLPKRCNIHGDPVFTNAIVDKNNRVRLFDMRGMQGDTLTLTGDANYDYAKVYQSLIGYDFVIRDLSIPEKRLQLLRDKFVEFCRVDEKIIAGISASLLFTCIPLQPKSTREKFLNLAKHYISFAVN